ncbi:uncharacterized protein LOC130957772 [Arachis stenosperma]|uniref:uncharacterized protein LOC130957772 n=1 Tax=Arachis stenosperma TaxID=217475 RepID=UPI0025AD695B|nr:uncharacterized protein LOC130957772 [Arachis stenosperma]
MSPFSQDMLDGIAGIGPSYKGPSYDKLRVHLLADLKRECQMLVDSYRSAWKETGCTLMADGWTDQRQRTLINFLVYCSKGLYFVKSIDASSIVKNASHLCNLFSEVIEWIDPNDILHIVTDNAANYVAAGRLINRKYDNIYWSPCAAHCLNLILKDISSMAHISNLATRALKITSIFDCKKDLQALVVDSIFTDHKLGRSATGMLRAEDAIKEMFRQNKTAYQLYTDIINSKWDKHLKKDLHACNNLDSVETMKEIHLYRDRKESFDRPETIRVASQLKPDEWWRLFGSSAPCLQKIIVCILSQASASSGCERNWSLFDQIHTKRRNRLEHDRLNDIVYVTYNLRLKSRKEKEKRKQKIQYDPIDYESISLVDFWVTKEVVEKEPDLPNNVDNLLFEIDADLYQSGSGSSGLYAASLDSSAQEGGNEGEDNPIETDLQQVLADFDD